MPINTNLLVAAPVLQDAFVDVSGKPMAAGTITCYKDNSRTTLKDWYYQTGSPGSYEYITLPNPLTLSASGTVCDDNGVDTIPFFYPFDEEDFLISDPYYITIDNYQETTQITRSNFPFMGTGSEEFEDATNAENYIVNNVFWRNCGTMNLNSVLDAIVCPGAHDGYQYPDIRFIKDSAGAIDTVTFNTFPLSATPALLDDPTPEYYLNHTCSSAGSSETMKYYQFPLSYHVKTLVGLNATFTIQAQNGGGSSSSESTIRIYLLQDLGTGAGTTRELLSSETITASWEKYQISYQFPGTAGLALSDVGNDAYYLQIGMPLNSICNLNFTKPSMYVVLNAAPTNNFQTYDEISPIINGARTGDVRTSLNSFVPFGWVPANDGTIGSATSGSTARANVDTWPLFNLIWSSVADSYAPIFDSAGAPTARGVSAYQDFVDNKRLSLTRSLGRVMGGAGAAGDGLTARDLGQYVGGETVVLLEANLPPHSHLVGGEFRVQTETSGPRIGSPTFMGPPSINTGLGDGTSAPVAIMQPSVFYNVFFKL